jgi:hypothetical protein
MSYDTADINNDLTLEVFASDIDFRMKPKRNECLRDDFVCRKFRNFFKQVKQGKIEECPKGVAEKRRDECLAFKFFELSEKFNDSIFCDYIPESQAPFKKYCYTKRKIKFDKYPPNKEHPPQVERNVFFLNKDNKLTEMAHEFRVDKSYWSWNSLFVDLDNDKFKDLIIVNGETFKPFLTPNLFLKNFKGKKFKDRSLEVGFDDDYNSTSFTFFDFDNNGTQDLLLNGVDGQLRFFQNHFQSDSITFQLINRPPNRFAIGAKIIITDSSNTSQIIELKKSGGYYSFNPYRVTFGLNKDKIVTQVKVIWPDGEENFIAKKFKANHIYQIRRK